MHDITQDLRIAVRNLWNHRGVSGFIALSVALAIAGNATVFAIVGGLMLRPFPYRDPGRLMFLWDVSRSQPDDQSSLSPANFIDLKARARSFSQIEAFASRSFSLTGGDRPEEVHAMRVTPGALKMLGYEPIRGRLLRPEEGTAGRDRVTLLAQGLWKERFGSDPGIVGKTIQLDDESYTVVGVLPASAEFVGDDVGLWVPMVLGPKPSRSERSLMVMARLAPGIPIAAAKREVDQLSRDLEKAYPDSNRGYGTEAVTLREQVPGKTDRMIFAMMEGVMALVLLIACVNVANLLLVRGQERQREIALRTTLGAGRGRLVRQLLSESLLLAIASGGIGLLLAVWSVRFLAKMLASQVPQAFLPQIDLPVVAFTTAVALLAGILFGLYPSFESTRPDLASVLREGGRGAAGNRRRRRVIRFLVVAEIAFALGALSATGLLVRTMVEIQSLDPGFDARNVLTLRLALPERRYAGDEAPARFYGQVAERLAALPGVQGVTAASALPRLRNQPTATFTVDGESAPRAQPPEEIALSVLPNYFATLKIPLVSGRGLSAADRRDGAPVVVVSQALARRYFPDQPALGRRLTIDGRSREIVGVVADVVQSRIPGREGPAPILYLPESQTGSRSLYLLLRAPATLAGLADPIRAAVGELDDALPVAGLATLEQRIREELVGPRLIAGILASFGAIALLLAALGIYGVISYSVSQQTQEIGVRLAIGAQRRTVLAGIARQGLLLTASGLLLGLPLVYLAVRGIGAILPGTVAQEATTVPAIAVLLGLVAAFATFLPAQRASELDPAIALRRD